MAQFITVVLVLSISIFTLSGCNQPGFVSEPDAQISSDESITQESQDVDSVLSDAFNYGWSFSSWSECSATSIEGQWSACQADGTQSRVCQSLSGFKVRQVYCKRNDGQVVVDSLCTEEQPTRVQSCQSVCQTAVEYRSCQQASVQPAATPIPISTPTPISTPVPTPSSQIVYASCQLSGYGQLNHGESVRTYTSSSVACSSSCTQTTITCVNGVLSGGSQYYASCQVNSLCRPNMAQFMIMSGCGGSYATYALYTYNNWQYFIDANQQVPDTSQAQTQLAQEVSDGIRSMENGVYGARNDFVMPVFPEPAVPGTIKVYFISDGRAAGVSFISSSGVKLTTSAFVKNMIEQHALGFGLGQKSLESFAQTISEGKHSWATFDVNVLSYYTKSTFKSKFPQLIEE